MNNRIPFITYLAFAFALGILLAFKVSLPITVLLIAIITLVLFAVTRNILFSISIIIFILAGFTLGLLSTSLEIKNDISNYYGKKVSAEGLVLSDNNKHERIASFQIRTTRINKKPIKKDLIIYSNTTKVRTGDVVRLSGLLKEPYAKHSYAKPSIFCNSKIIIAGKNIFWTLIGTSRRWIRGQLLINRSEAKAFLYAMITSQTNELSNATRENLRVSGLSHLLAVSGLHTGFVILIILIILRLLKFRAGWQLVILSFLLFIFVAFTGFKPPVVRASIMASSLSFTFLLGRKKNLFASLSSAAMFSLALEPIALFEPSFQLSYTAVFSILLFKEKISLLLEGMPDALNSLISIGLSVQLLTLPFVAYHFKAIPIYALLANLLVVPIAALTYYLTCIALLFRVIGFDIFWLPSIFGAYILKIGSLIAALPVSTIMVNNIIVVVLFVCVIILSLYFLKAYEKSINFATALIILLSVFAAVQWWPAAETIVGGKKLEVEFLDVGQGDATMIRGPGGEKVLIDSGPKPYAIEQHLIKRRIRSLDLVVATHADADHIGGMAQIIKNFKVKNVLDNGIAKKTKQYKNYIKEIMAKNILRITAKRNQNVKVGSLTFIVLNPKEDYVTDDIDNDNSVVLKLDYLEESFLFTADIGFEVEKDLVNSSNLKSTVLKVAHHGSASSTSAIFLDYVEPKYAVISVGRDNRYGHPRSSVLKRLAFSRATIYRTDDVENIKMVVSKKGLTVYD